MHNLHIFDRIVFKVSYNSPKIFGSSLFFVYLCPVKDLLIIWKRKQQIWFRSLCLLAR